MRRPMSERVRDEVGDTQGEERAGSREGSERYADGRGGARGGLWDTYGAWNIPSMPGRAQNEGGDTESTRVGVVTGERAENGAGVPARQIWAVGSAVGSEAGGGEGATEQAIVSRVEDVGSTAALGGHWGPVGDVGQGMQRLTGDEGGSGRDVVWGLGAAHRAEAAGATILGYVVRIAAGLVDRDNRWTTAFEEFEDEFEEYCETVATDLSVRGLLNQALRVSHVLQEEGSVRHAMANTLVRRWVCLAHQHDLLDKHIAACNRVVDEAGLPASHRTRRTNCHPKSATPAPPAAHAGSRAGAC